MSFEGFPDTLRLTQSAEYKAVFDQTEYKVSAGSLLLLARCNSLGQSRIGLIVSKKVINLAVQRNRVKRLLRESFRLHHRKIPGLDIVILGRQGLGKRDNKNIFDTTAIFWQELETQISAPVTRK